MIITDQIFFSITSPINKFNRIKAFVLIEFIFIALRTKYISNYCSEVTIYS